jgi:hypothetical protein
MTITEDDLIEYLETAWDTDNAALPGFTKDATLLNHVGKLLVRRIKIDPKWVAGTMKQVTDFYEFRLSHPDKDAGINELVRVLMDCPASIFYDSFNADMNRWESVTNTAVVNGRAMMTGTGSFQKTWTGAVPFTPIFPTSIKFQYEISELNCFVAYIYKNVYAWIIYVYSNDTTMKIITQKGLNNVPGITMTPGVKYDIEFCNFTNWTTGTLKCDVYVNDVLKFSQLSVDDNVTGVTRMGFASTSTAYVDNVKVVNASGSVMERLPISVGTPQYEGYDNLSKMHYHSLIATMTRWE